MNSNAVLLNKAVDEIRITIGFQILREQKKERKKERKEINELILICNKLTYNMLAQLKVVSGRIRPAGRQFYHTSVTINYTIG
jgi:hypothetical protein